MKGCSIKSTKPDFYFEDLVNQHHLAIYLDGLSKEIHGSIDRQRADNMIRTWLEAGGTNVIAISAASLDDPAIMDLYRTQISRELSR